MSDGPGRVLDARVVPFACICWGATALGVVAGASVATIGAAVLLVLLILVLVLRAGRGYAVRWPIAGLLLFGVLVCSGIAWRAHAVESHPLRAAADDRSTVTMVGSIADSPVMPRSAGAGGWQRVRVHVRMEEVRFGHRTVRVGGVVTVYAPAEGWADLLPGQRAWFRAKLEAPRRSDLTVAIARADTAPQHIDPASWYQRWAAVVRQRFALAAERALPPDQAGLLPGLVVGDRSGLDGEVIDAFEAAGLSHLTAVSGANVSIVLGAVLLIARGVGLGPRTVAALAAFALIAFVVIARPSPSVLRAAAMGSVTILAMVTGRRKQALPALSGSVVLLLLVRPQLAVDFGFALSVVATLALIVIAPGWSDRLRARGWPRAVAEIVAVSTAAFVVTAPLVAAMTGTVSVVSIAANILVAPVIAVITVCGGVTALVAVASVPLAEWGARSVTLPLWWLLTVADNASSTPWAAVEVPSGARGAAATIGVIVFVLTCWLGTSALRNHRRGGVARSSRAQFRSDRPTPPRTR